MWYIYELFLEYHWKFLIEFEYHKFLNSIKFRREQHVLFARGKQQTSRFQRLLKTLKDFLYVTSLFSKYFNRLSETSTISLDFNRLLVTSRDSEGLRKFSFIQIDFIWLQTRSLCSFRLGLSISFPSFIILSTLASLEELTLSYNLDRQEYGDTDLFLLSRGLKNLSQNLVDQLK